MSNLFQYYFLVYIFFVISNAQVAPNFQPYSLKHQNIKFSSSKIEIKKNQFSLNYIENTQALPFPDGRLYRLTLSFDGKISGHILINNWNVPDGAMLFILNDQNSYTGPYLFTNQIEFLSGRFIAENLIFEYFEPMNSLFSGSFEINGIVPDNLVSIEDDVLDQQIIISNKQDRPKIMLTGYWPPTNEMVRHFSQNSEINPNGWQGENWENLGFDVMSFFPQFNPPNCNDCGQGYGDLEVDYQDFSQDFWPIVNSIQPLGIITFSRGYNDMSWELESRLVNRTNWVDDYTPPLLPTPNPPDSTVDNFYVRYTSLPVSKIISDIESANLGLTPYLDNTNAGMFLSEFAGYHGVWYKESHDNQDDSPCYAGGHIHVGAQVDWDIAKEAAEISLRALINHLSGIIVISGDCNSDSQVNILDIIYLTNVILGFDEFSNIEAIAADIDQNGQLDILDIISIVNIILMP